MPPPPFPPWDGVGEQTCSCALNGSGAVRATRGALLPLCARDLGIWGARTPPSPPDPIPLRNLEVGARGGLEAGTGGAGPRLMERG